MPHIAQWVAARRPSSNPASASRKVPLHTEAVRLALFDACLSQSTRLRELFIARIMAGAPGTISVSIDWSSKALNGRVSTARPSAVWIRPPVRLAVCSL
ncbi:hypothetical protein D9M71_564340 [compost metagenome]